MTHPSFDHPPFLWSTVSLVIQRSWVQFPTGTATGMFPCFRQRLPQTLVLLCSMTPFNLGHATCDGGAQGEQIGLACLIAPVPPRLSIYLGTEAKRGKGGELEGGGGVGTMWLCLAPRKGSCAWAAGPDRQPLPFTLHKHKQPCLG